MVPVVRSSGQPPIRTASCTGPGFQVVITSGVLWGGLLYRWSRRGIALAARSVSERCPDVRNLFLFGHYEAFMAPGGMTPWHLQCRAVQSSALTGPATLGDLNICRKRAEGLVQTKPHIASLQQGGSRMLGSFGESECYELMAQRV